MVDIVELFRGLVALEVSVVLFGVVALALRMYGPDAFGVVFGERLDLRL